ncbi:MAG: multiheme c-type cytochrome [Verrucomicrobiota bacterium]
MLRFNLCVPIALILLCAVTASAKEPNQTREGPAEFVGATGCKSSSCHGGAGPKREQFTIWSRQDFHSRAFAILTSARSARIAETVGGGGAPANTRCTVCHSPFQSVSQTRLAATAHPDEGVSCESCHGAAEAWLRGHTRPDWTYAMRVTAGMRDLRSLYVRANACVACHQNIDNDILRAGHPTMLFELDSQSNNQPKHWRDEDPPIGPRAWLTGQAVALREAAWRSRTDNDPAADMQETSLALAWLLAKVTASAPALPVIAEPSSSDLEPLQHQADDLARRAVDWSPNTDALFSMLRALAASDSEFHGSKRTKESQLYCAQRLVLALDRLSAALNQARAEPLKIDNELKSLREDMGARENFDPARFTEHLRAFRSKL